MYLSSLHLFTVYLVTSDVIFRWFDDYDGADQLGVHTHEFICDSDTTLSTLF